MVLVPEDNGDVLIKKHVGLEDRDRLHYIKVYLCINDVMDVTGF